MNAPYRYAYLGPAGTFTEEALRQVADAQTNEFLPASDVVAALRMVREGRADYAVVPIENSVEGGVNATLDTLARGKNLVIVAEMIVDISFVLCVKPGTKLADIERTATHPHAWAQCRGWMADNAPGARHIPATSTASAAELLATGTDVGFDSALCSRLSAELYDLEILADGVADNRGATTRFILVGPPGTIPAPTGADKTTLIVHLPDNESGALLTVLEQLSVRGVNMSRIESRPLGDALGRYSFSMDLEGHVADERVQAALVGLHRVCPLVRYMGSYPRADGRKPRLSPGTSDSDFDSARNWVSSLTENIEGARSHNSPVGG